MSGPHTLVEFNALDQAGAAEILGACLDVDEWVATVDAGRPYADLASLHESGSAAADPITWDQCAGALARHPRIGERKAAVEGTAAESAWSREEQSGVAQDEQPGSQDALRQGNEDYEARFGHIFLICASGLSAEQILAALHRRLAHDDVTEQVEVMSELRKIALLRLARSVIGLDQGPTPG